jgi:hypothetical protein
MKKTTFILVATMLLSISSAWAQTWQIGSPNAEDLSATLKDGVLTLSGTGTTKNYNVNDGMAPWFERRAEVTTVIVEEGVTGIGMLIFQNHSSLTDVLLPSTLQTLGSLAFQNCTGLKEITVLNPVPPASSGQYPFSGVTVRNVILFIPVGSDAAYRANSTWSSFYILEEGTVPLLCVPTVAGKFGFEDSWTWYMCGTTDLYVRGEGEMRDFEPPFPGYEDIAPWAGRLDRTITKIVVEEGVTSLGYAAFNNSWNLREVVLPNSLRHIGWMALGNHFRLAEINVPEGVITIGNGAFAGNVALSRVTIPSTVTTIEGHVFAICYSMRSITVKNPVPPTLGLNVFAGSGETPGVNMATCTLTVPKGSKAAYQAAEGWKKFLNIVEGDFVSIDHIENATKTAAGYYNFTGQKLPQEPENGLYIIVYDDGSTEKIMKK